MSKILSNAELLELLKTERVEEFNVYCRKHPGQKIDLSEAYLRDKILRGVELSGVELSRADLSGAKLNGAKLNGAYLYGANLNSADLSGADLTDVLVGNILNFEYATFNDTKMSGIARVILAARADEQRRFLLSTRIDN